MHSWREGGAPSLDSDRLDPGGRLAAAQTTGHATTRSTSGCCARPRASAAGDRVDGEWRRGGSGRSRPMLAACHTRCARVSRRWRPRGRAQSRDTHLGESLTSQSTLPPHPLCRVFACGPRCTRCHAPAPRAACPRRAAVRAQPGSGRGCRAPAGASCPRSLFTCCSFSRHSLLPRARPRPLRRTTAIARR